MKYRVPAFDRRYVRPAIGVVISGVSAWLLLRLIDERLVVRDLAAADPWLVGLAVALLFLSLGAKVARWQALLPAESRLGYGRLFAILHASMFLNNVLPMRAGDLARGAMTGRDAGVPRTHVISSMVAERVVDALVLTVCFVAVMPVVGLELAPERSRGLAVIAGAVMALGVAVAIAVTAGRRRLGGGRAPRMLVELAASGRRATSRDGWPVWAWSGTAWVLAFGLNYSLFRAMGIEVHPLVAVIVTCSTNVSMLVPSSPGHVGVYHAAAMATLLAAGVGSTEAASFSALSHLVNVVPVSLVGALFLSFGVRGGMAVGAAEDEVVVDAELRDAALKDPVRGG